MKNIVVLLLTLCVISCQEVADTPQNKSTMEAANADISPLKTYMDSLATGFDAIPAERKVVLDSLTAYLKNQQDSGATTRLTFICTHNSRRSHMGQIWAMAAAEYYRIPRIETYSGGTEVTAFNPRAVAAMQRAGFLITAGEGANPRYKVSTSEAGASVTCFSKKYNDASNPAANFAAIMTCSQADAECPFIPGASFRLALPYLDPKEADGTPEETARYDERCRQIGWEIMYAFSRL